MNFAELKEYAADNNITNALTHIQAAEDIFNNSDKMSDFDKMRAQQKINKKLQLASMMVEDHKTDQARVARFKAMSAEELAVATASTEVDIDHAPLRELSDEERKTSDKAFAESQAKQHAHENEEHVDGRPY